MFPSSFHGRRSRKPPILHSAWFCSADYIMLNMFWQKIKAMDSVARFAPNSAGLLQDHGLLHDYKSIMGTYDLPNLSQAM